MSDQIATEVYQVGRQLKAKLSLPTADSAVYALAISPSGRLSPTSRPLAAGKLLMAKICLGSSFLLTLYLAHPVVAVSALLSGVAFWLRRSHLAGMISVVSRFSEVKSTLHQALLVATSQGSISFDAPPKIKELCVRYFSKGDSLGGAEFVALYEYLFDRVEGVNFYEESPEGSEADPVERDFRRLIGAQQGVQEQKNHLDSIQARPRLDVLAKPPSASVTAKARDNSSDFQSLLAQKPVPVPTSSDRREDAGRPLDLDHQETPASQGDELQTPANEEEVGLSTKPTEASALAQATEDDPLDEDDPFSAFEDNEDPVGAAQDLIDDLPDDFDEPEEADYILSDDLIDSIDEIEREKRNDSR